MDPAGPVDELDAPTAPWKTPEHVSTATTGITQQQDISNEC
jgi:hypothetical protein